MSTTWVIVGHRAGARILEKRGPDLEVVADIEHSAGRLKDGEILADRAGRAFDGTGSPRAMGTEVSPHDHVATVFAREIAETLRSGRNENRFDRLVLVAEPRFLGMLRGALDDTTASLVGATVGKDLARVAVRDLPGHLGDALRA